MAWSLRLWHEGRKISRIQNKIGLKKLKRAGMTKKKGEGSISKKSRDDGRHFGSGLVSGSNISLLFAPPVWKRPFSKRPGTRWKWQTNNVYLLQPCRPYDCVPETYAENQNVAQILRSWKKTGKVARSQQEFGWFFILGFLSKKRIRKRFFAQHKKHRELSRQDVNGVKLSETGKLVVYELRRGAIISKIQSEK